MSKVSEHYDNLLADFYSWMFGDFDKKVKDNEDFFLKNEIKPGKTKIAIDLGSGSGFQSIALAKIGFSVKAIDFCKKLLDELERKKDNLNITTIQGDLSQIKTLVRENADVIVCMGDTLPHLESLDDIDTLFKNVYDKLDTNGKFIVTFRDTSNKLKNTDRFIPVRSDDNTIFTCILEYEDDYINVYDLVYNKVGERWEMHISNYRKLIIQPLLAKLKLEFFNFEIMHFSVNKGMVTIIAKKK